MGVPRVRGDCRPAEEILESPPSHLRGRQIRKEGLEARSLIELSGRRRTRIAHWVRPLAAGNREWAQNQRLGSRVRGTRRFSNLRKQIRREPIPQAENSTNAEISLSLLLPHSTADLAAHCFLDCHLEPGRRRRAAERSYVTLQSWCSMLSRAQCSKHPIRVRDAPHSP